MAKNIYDAKTALDNVDKDQGDLLLEIGDFNKDTKPKDICKKNQKKILLLA